ncbi:hypothetical protein BCR35DRAFT_292966 [Leucosporidium creatinivorum]|uniref:PBP domain-containing protein n=1 Tax=Leucosporidium creatinivorum TaxID=106004 RepID=A0A1Y2EUS4_9BASI|nr:hypothetical protein BCR35DRAFT_292966 [Leucosporidium creatinivorum]
MTRTTALQAHGAVVSTPSEIYGEQGGPVAFRLGNGGAGPTGLLKLLSQSFLDEQAPDSCVPWICNHSRATQMALFQGHVDVILVYERDQEKLSADEGWAQEMGIAFHDHFVVVGPRGNPARVELGDSPAVAFKKIAESGAPFHSRADGSATMVKERHIWSQLNLSPWTTTPSWYTQTTLTPAEALVKADAAGAYLLSDRSTLLRQTQLGTISHSTVFYEPTSSSDFLMNSCAALVSDKPSEMALRFVTWLLADKAQSIIAEYGRVEAGLPFFAAVGAGYAKSTLLGGYPSGGKWRSWPRASL